MPGAELPLEGLGKLEPVLTEVIFSQMLRLPTPHFKPIAYATILVCIPLIDSLVIHLSHSSAQQSLCAIHD